jgi:hypothetical protein
VILIYFFSIRKENDFILNGLMRMLESQWWKKAGERKQLYLTIFPVKS